MFGLGNDFIVLDARKDPSVCIPKHAKQLHAYLQVRKFVFIIRVFTRFLLTLARLADFDGVRAEACDCAD